MAWVREESDVPTSIGKIFIVMRDYDGVAANHEVRYKIHVLDQDGKTMTERMGGASATLDAGADSERH